MTTWDVHYTGQFDNQLMELSDMVQHLCQRTGTCGAPMATGPERHLRCRHGVLLMPEPNYLFYR